MKQEDHEKDKKDKEEKNSHGTISAHISKQKTLKVKISTYIPLHMMMEQKYKEIKVFEGL